MAPWPARRMMTLRRRAGAMPWRVRLSEGLAIRLRADRAFCGPLVELLGPGPQRARAWTSGGTAAEACRKRYFQAPLAMFLAVAGIARPNPGAVEQRFAVEALMMRPDRDATDKGDRSSNLLRGKVIREWFIVFRPRRRSSAQSGRPVPLEPPSGCGLICNAPLVTRFDLDARASQG